MTAPTRASAPVRLDFAGGWTDVPPFSTEEGGVVVSAAISPRVHVEFTPGGSDILIIARDLGLSTRIASTAALVPEGPLALHQAALRMLPPGPGTLRTHAEAPAGSGLGSSGALDVALIAALSRARGEALDAAACADLGWRLETIEAGHPGGRQDQYAAAFGGFLRLEFLGKTARVERIGLDSQFAVELARRILVCYTGRSRVSGNTIARVMDGYVRGDAAITGALREMRQIALEMADALRQSSLGQVGALIQRNWACQQRLDPAMRTAEMARLEAAMSQAGSLGGKAAGAGAGGCMFFLMAGDLEAGREVASAAGATIVEAEWSAAGVEVC